MISQEPIVFQWADSESGGGWFYNIYKLKCYDIVKEDLRSKLLLNANNNIYIHTCVLKTAFVCMNVCIKFIVSFLHCTI